MLGSGERICLIDRIRAGVVVPPEDMDDRARVVEWLADQPDEAESIGQREKAFAVEHCSWDILVGEWCGQLEVAAPGLANQEAYQAPCPSDGGGQ